MSASEPGIQTRSGERASRRALSVRGFLVVLVLLTILGPGIRIRPEMPTLKMEDVLLVIAVVWAAMSRQRQILMMTTRSEILVILRPFLVLMGWVICSTMLYYGMGSAITTVTLSEILITVLTLCKPVLLAAVIVAGARDFRTQNILALTVMGALVIETLILYEQGTDAFGIRALLMELYGREDERFMALGARVIGTFGGPNPAAVAVAAMFALIVSRAIFSSMGFIQTVFHVVICAGSVLAITEFTGSRTALIACMVALVVAMGVGWLTRLQRSKMALLTVAVAVGASLSLGALMQSRYVDRYASLMQGGGGILYEDNFQGRIANWKAIVDHIGPAWFQGIGVSGALDWGVTDSTYASLLLFGGIAAIFLYAWWQVRMAVFIGRCVFDTRRIRRDWPGIGMAAGGLTALAVQAVGGVAVPIFASTRLFSTCMVVIGLGVAASATFRRSLIEKAASANAS